MITHAKVPEDNGEKILILEPTDPVPLNGSYIFREFPDSILDDCLWFQQDLDYGVFSGLGPGYFLYRGGLIYGRAMKRPTLLYVLENHLGRDSRSREPVGIFPIEPTKLVG